jgi:hypothetical protein
MSDSCDRMRERIDDALDGRLPPEAEAAFSAHVRSCPACGSEWELASALRGSLLNIGLDPAPPGLKDAIAASVRRGAATPRPAPVWTYARVAAVLLLTVTIGWFAWDVVKSKPTAPAPADEKGAMVAEARATPPAPAQKPAKDVVVVWGGDPGAPPMTEGMTARLDDRTSSALSKARRIAERSPEAASELNEIVSADAGPEQRQQQAEFLVRLMPNLGALTDAAGDASGLSSLARDADDAITVFSEAGVRREAGEKDAERKRDETSDALKVARAAPSAPGADKAAARADAGSEPAFYMVSGPGAIARVELVLRDRSLAFRQVRLTDRPANEKTQKLEQRDADYRIIEVDVPEATFDETIGELESLAGLRLAPVGVASVELSPAPAEAAATIGKAKKETAKPGARGAPPAAEGTRPESRPAPRAAGGGGAQDRPKSLPIRKLRLILMGR